MPEQDIRQLSFVEAIREALDQLLDTDPSVMIIGDLDCLNQARKDAWL